MKFSLVCLMPLMLLGDFVSAQSSLNEICAGSNNLSGCKATITVPNGVKVITTRKQFKKANKCKTTKKVTYNCGTKQKPKKCTRNACVPGFDITYKNVPTSLQINYVKINLCNKVRQVLGTALGNKFIKARDPICNCFTKLRTLNSEGKFASSSAGNFDLANTNYLDQSEKLQTCLANGGLPYGHNRVATLNKLKATGWAVALGADMDRATYRAMIAVIHPCRVTGVCNSAAIYAVFSNYATASYRILLGPVFPVLTRWIENLDLLKKSTGYVVSATGDVETAYENIESTLNNYEYAICSSLGYCGTDRPNILNFMDNINTLASLAYKISGSRQKIYGYNQNVISLLNEATQLRSNVGKVPAATEMVSRIQNNEIKVAKDVFKFMPFVQGMPTTAKRVQTELEPLKAFVREYLADASALKDLIEGMLAIDWETEHQQDFDEDQNGVYVRNGLIAIQSNIKDGLADAVKTYYYLINAVNEQLKDFTLTNGRWRLETGTTAFQRWSTLNMDVPCTKTTKTKYTKSGLTKWSNSHRTFWKCHFGPHDSQYPAVHVPYMRIYE
ncbi:hypothetical protein ACHAPT_006137 [Fusarium lateritium]